MKTLSKMLICWRKRIKYFLNGSISLKYAYKLDEIFLKKWSKQKENQPCQRIHHEYGKILFNFSKIHLWKQEREIN